MPKDGSLRNKKECDTQSNTLEKSRNKMSVWMLLPKLLYTLL